jgi:SAM-dependent methyltransferase
VSEPGNDPYDLEAGTSEHYADAELYDFEYRRRRRDVTVYRELARRWAGGGGPILELGCGSGRVLAPLARDGHDVVGIDLSRTMLARAAARVARLPARAAARVRLMRADMRSLPVIAGASSGVPLVICPFNGMMHLYGRADLAAMLAEVRRVLAPGGRFAFDVLNPDLRWLTRDPHRRWARTRFTHPATGEKLVYTTNQTYEPISQIAYIRIYYERDGVEPEESKRTRVVRLAHRQFFPAELEGICTSAGFRIEDRWGGFSGEPLEGDSESQVVLCSARGAR